MMPTARKVSLDAWYPQLCRVVAPLVSRDFNTDRPTHLVDCLPCRCNDETWKTPDRHNLARGITALLHSFCAMQPSVHKYSCQPSSGRRLSVRYRHAPQLGTEYGQGCHSFARMGRILRAGTLHYAPQRHPQSRHQATLSITHESYRFGLVSVRCVL
ncbi:hypothetical protein BGZ61DRAFT_443071 [Ilyonectria robusta]|uniref:uncharacterized protein n=1 Tax=Ilyonectria robusta TaxID=1079257 RepID=UPI001E8E358A|nr:uncharacterized protein BGZ61DRAFT_443071 [Ilyonectria robusta]KAH8734755.1 hypothetical protein BGZ61DRAFT_443071 [Ilyonectria robusta]